MRPTSYPRLTALLVLAASLLATAARAQPSDAQVEKDHRGEGVIKVVVFPDGRLKELNPVSGLWEYSCRISVTSKSTEYPGLNEVVRSEVDYVQQGGRWTEVSTGISADRYYEGLPNPTADDLAAFVAMSGWKSLLGFYYNKVVGAVERYELVPDTYFHWTKPTNVAFLVHAELRLIVSNTEIQHVRLKLRLKLARDDMHGPWLKVVEVSAENRAPEALGDRETFTADEVRRMRTLATIEGEAKSLAMSVQLPDFKSALELAEHAYGLLHTASPEQWEGFIRSALVKKPAYLVPGSDVLLNQRGKEKIDQPIARVIKVRASFQRQFCPRLKLKARQQAADGGVVFVFTDKGDTSNNTMKVVDVDGRFMLDDIAIYPVRNAVEVEAIPPEVGCAAAP